MYNMEAFIHVHVYNLYDAHLYDCFPTGLNYIYIYIYILVSPTRVCVVYVVKEVTSFPGARSINGRGV